MLGTEEGVMGEVEGGNVHVQLVRVLAIAWRGGGVDSIA